MREDRPSQRAALLQAFVLLALVGASLALFAHQLGARPRLWSGVWRDNALLLGARRWVLASMVGVIAVLWAGAAAWLWHRGLDGARSVERAARLSSPLMLLGLVPGIASVDAWPDALQASIVIAAFVLGLEPLMRRALGAVSPEAWSSLAGVLARLPSRVRRWMPTTLIGVAMIGYAAYMAYFTLRNHQRFNTSSYDLGIYDNQFWQALHGHPFRSTPVLSQGGDWSVLKSHAELAMYAFLPLYAIRPGPETLLVLQSVVLAAGAIPIYRFAGRRLSRATACVLALAYLIYPPLHGANFYDFHFQPLGAVFVLYAIDFLDERRWISFAVTFALALATREDTSLMLLAHGLFLVVTAERLRAGAAVAAISALYFAVVKFIVMPHFGNWWFAEMYRDLFPPDAHSFGGILQTLIVNPVYVMRTLLVADKLRYVLQLFVPLAFLPLRWPRLWWFAGPGFLLTLLSTKYPAAVDISFQYSAYWFALLFPATALGLAALRDGEGGVVRQRSACVALLAGSLLATAHFGAIPPHAGFRSGFGEARFSRPSDADRKKAIDLAELVKMIPVAAKLAVSENALPHVSKRSECYSLKDGVQGADYILYAPGEQGADHAVEAQRSGQMKVLASRPGLVLLQRAQP